MSDYPESTLIEIRRQLHRIPELALTEVKTQTALRARIDAMPQAHLTVHVPASAPTGLLVHVAGTNPTKTVGWRTDIDALPLTETTGLPFASEHPGVAHACGHDLHMTVALGLLQHFASQPPRDNMVFLFQPAEESESGAKRLYDGGELTGKWQPDELYGLHDRPDLPTGTIGTTVGTLFAGTTEIDVTITGKGGHAAFPQNANDAAVAAASYLMQVQTIVARNVAPTNSAVITFGLMEAGTIRNVIAQTAHLAGTLRGFTQQDIAFLQQRLRDLGTGIAASYNVEVAVALNQGGYYPVENNPELARFAVDYFKNSEAPFVDTPGVMTGEDFGYLLHHIPGVMFWLGVGAKQELHTADFTPDEGALLPGVTAIAGFLAARMAI